MKFMHRIAGVDSKSQTGKDAGAEQNLEIIDSKQNTHTYTHTHLPKIVGAITKRLRPISANNKTGTSTCSTHHHPFVSWSYLASIVAHSTITDRRWSYHRPQVAASIGAPLHVGAGQLERVSTAGRRRKHHLGEGLLRPSLSGSDLRRRRSHSGRCAQHRRALQSHAVGDHRTSAIVGSDHVNSLVKTGAFLGNRRRSSSTDRSWLQWYRTVVRFLQYRCSRAPDASRRHRQFQTLQWPDFYFPLTLSIVSLHRVEIHRRRSTAVVHSDSFATETSAVSSSDFDVVLVVVTRRRPSTPTSLTVVTAEQVHRRRCYSLFSTALGRRQQSYLLSGDHQPQLHSHKHSDGSRTLWAVLITSMQ